MATSADDPRLDPPSGEGQGDPRQRDSKRTHRSTSRGPTPELKQAADELAGRVSRGQAVTFEDLVKIRTLGALDLIRSSRPTARAKGLELLEEVNSPRAAAPAAGYGDETPI